MDEKLPGYRGEALRILKEAYVEVGDLIRIEKAGVTYEGILMPRSELGDERHITIKIRSGYNIGVRITSDMRVEKKASVAKPSFIPPPPPKQKPGMPKVTIISTGGTIASRVDYRTGAVRPAISASDLYSIVPELSDIATIDTEILFSMFSEDLTPKHWSQIAMKVAEHIKRGAQGVVITHGTDTMGYTAAALSFAIQKLPVPVVLVGAQRSEDRPSSDAAENLIGAVLCAARAPFAEVVVAMHQTISDEAIAIHRGTKVRKLHTSRRDAFKSVNSNLFWAKKDYLTEAYPHHLLQTYAEMKASGLPEGRILYISKDDLTTAEFGLFLNSPRLEELYEEDVRTMTKYIREGIEPPKPPDIIFDPRKKLRFQYQGKQWTIEGCYTENWQIERSMFISKITGIKGKTQKEVVEKWKSKIKGELKDKNDELKADFKAKIKKVGKNDKQ